VPELPVVAAGSLPDFALAEHKFSMPVGRIGYLYLEPLSFEEFLNALGNHELHAYMQNYTWDFDIPDAIRLQLIKLIKEYLIVGGMPAAVLSRKTENNSSKLNQIHFDLLATYRGDFVKYKGRLSVERLEELINAIPQQLGEKLVYSHVNSELSSAPLKEALDVLSKATICHRMTATAANSLPLEAEINEKFLKVIMLDCGLCCAELGLSRHRLASVSEISVINNRGMVE